MTSTRSATLNLIAFLLTAIGGSGQPQARTTTSRTEFEVASIKPSRSPVAAPAIRITPGRLTVENLTLRRLIFVAYRVHDFQISNGPGWIGSDRYDIDAKTASTTGADAMLLMLQALLEDRFHLRFHHETKEGAVYVLTLAKNGSKMHEASCLPFDPNNLPRQAGLSDIERRDQCSGISRKPSELDGNGMSMEDAAGPAFQSLTGQLSLILDRPVVNRTGLTGRYDVHLRWNADQPTGGVQNEPGNPSTSLPATDQSAPSIFTTLQEQLGLKLESGKGPVDNFVIDSVDKPSEN
jgi:uncharacterized protein (TIGR03435 family)